MSELTILSLGAGVQSSTLALMAAEGYITPAVDVAIFADTGWEPPEVYEYLEYLREHVPFPIETVSAGDLRADALAGKHEAWLPMFAAGMDGRRELMLRRQCTTNYKIRPIRRRIQALRKERGVKRVTQYIGISLDEIQRMKPSGVQYLRHDWPLITARMTRNDCVQWLERRGYRMPAKSACIGCPFHDDAYWRDMKYNRPEQWGDAVAFDDQMRHADRRLTREHRPAIYLHRSCVPLEQVDLRTAGERGQLPLWDIECEGMCGV